MSFKWPTTTIETLKAPRTAVAPWIISASRATDIPACYSEWFFDKLEKGVVQWVNPSSVYGKIVVQLCRYYQL